MVGLGKKDLQNLAKENLDLLDPMSLVYISYETPPDSSKIVNFIINWKTTYKDAKTIGGLLKKVIINKFHKGLKVVNEAYSAYDSYLEKFYWSEDILAFKDRLYKSGGVIQVITLIKEK